MRQPGKCTRLQQHWEQKVSVNRRLHLLPERGSMLVPKNPSGAPPAATASPGASQWPHGHGAASRTQQRVGVKQAARRYPQKGKTALPHPRKGPRGVIRLSLLFSWLFARCSSAWSPAC